MAKANNIHQRAIEIRNFLILNELDLATKRLMDFVADFSYTRTRLNETINIRAMSNQLREDRRLFGFTDQIHSRTQSLINQVLGLIDDVIDESDQLQKSETGNVPEFPHRVSQSKNEDAGVLDHREGTKTAIEIDRIRFSLARNKRKLKGAIVVDAKGITRNYGRTATNFVLGPLDLQLKLGEITLVVGENGSGKSTLLDIIASERRYDTGILSYPDLAASNHATMYSTRQQIAYIPQILPLWNGSVLDTLRFSAAIHSITGPSNEAETDFILSRLALEKYRMSTWNELSGGFKMRFALAESLIWHPRLLILDEPLAYLDMNAQVHFLQDLRDLAHSEANPLSVLISSQHLHEVESISDHIIFLRDGKIIYAGETTLLGLDQDKIFELECDLDKEKLIDLLEPIQFKSIEMEGNTFILHLSTHHTVPKVLHVLAEKEVEVKLFRDISNSSRRLFRG